MEEPRTHYQISLTARQAVGLFVGLLLALGVAFFLGLMAGASGRRAAPVEAAPEQVAAPGPVEKPTAAAETVPLVETGVPTSAGSRTELAPGNVTPVPAEPTTPATLQTFEDGAPEDGGTAAQAVPTRVPVAPSAAKAPAPKVRGPAPASGRIWVQAASLQSHDEANALTARLSRHGYHAVMLTASGPRGKVYRVRVGPYRTEDEAARAVAQLARQEKIREPWVVPEGK